MFSITSTTLAASTNNWDFAHVLSVFAWIVQACLCVPMLLLLKYESNSLREDACAENSKEKANFLRYLSYTATWSVLFFGWLFLHSILHADAALSAGANTDSHLSSGVMLINNYVGALLVLVNGGNFAYIAYRLYQRALIAKKAGDQKGFLTNLSGGIFETGIVGIYFLLFLYWAISLFANPSNLPNTLKPEYTAYILLVISILCLTSFCAACFGIHIKRKDLKLVDPLHRKRKIIEVVQFCVLTTIVLAFGLITLSGFLIDIK